LRLILAVSRKVTLAAQESGDTALMETLRAQIQEMEAEKNALKEQVRQKIEEMKEIMRQKYSLEELENINTVAEQLGKVKGVKVLPVTCIFMKSGNVKFDTPPVIKEGRTLLPLRAISEATGAAVAWDAVERKVTITQGEKEIVFSLAEGKVFVDGVEANIDVPGQVMNNRTMVPMRFIIENLGLKVQWDADTETIEIE